MIKTHEEGCTGFRVCYPKKIIKQSSCTFKSYIQSKGFRKNEYWEGRKLGGEVLFYRYMGLGGIHTFMWLRYRGRDTLFLYSYVTLVDNFIGNRYT